MRNRRNLGIDPAALAAGKSLGVVLPDGIELEGRRKAPPAPHGRRSQTYPPGSTVVRFVVAGRPVPWKVPMVLRSGVSVKSAAVLRWQTLVRLTAEAAMAGQPLHAGPAGLRLDFVFAGSRKVGDTTNLQKCFEDALQGSVIVNDRDVIEVHVTRRFGDADRTEVEVYVPTRGGEQ